jgi:hypothetical protein
MFANDIVIVTPSGNFGELNGHENVDLPPKIWAADDFPLIVVGAVDTQGKDCTQPRGTEKLLPRGPQGHCLGTRERRDLCISHQQRCQKGHRHIACISNDCWLSRLFPLL